MTHRRTNRQNDAEKRLLRWLGTLSLTLTTLSGCASSRGGWNLLSWGKAQEYRAPPADERRYQEPPTYAGLPRRDTPTELRPRDNRVGPPVGPNTPPLGRPSPVGALP
ncbi:MAG: hypothetical protein RMI91_12525 [Gemmatales bacterium]|nr:hypothetical protein [Gemmatales bacterium]MDW7995467.1 hypothetical protein [Gemmatales bacterium]